MAAGPPAQDHHLVVFPRNPVPGSLGVIVLQSRAQELRELENERQARVWTVRGIVSDHVPLSGGSDASLARAAHHLLELNENPLSIYLHRGGNNVTYYDLVASRGDQLDYIEVRVETDLPSNAFLLARQPLNELLDAIVRGQPMPLLYKHLELISPLDGGVLAYQMILPFRDGIRLGPLGGIIQWPPFAPYEARCAEASVIGSHIVPRYYLEQFTVKKKKSAKTGYLWVYSTDAPPRLGTARNEGRENGYFGFPLGDGTLDERLEGELQKVEDRATDVLACAGSELFVWSIRARQVLASYCGHLYARVRARREAAFWLNDKVWKEFSELLDNEEFINGLAARYKVSPAQARQQMSDLATAAITPAERKKAFLADIPLNARWMADVLLAKQWCVWSPVEMDEFITSDNPLVSARPIGDRFAPGFGFARADVLVLFPLNPKSCLVMGGAPKGYRRANHLVVDEINRCLVYSMTRNAFSRTRSLLIASYVQNFGGKLRFGENAFVLTGGQPSVREFLEARLNWGGA